MYDIGIIGGGPGGYVAAERAGQHGLKVILFEEKELGGVCLNEGCIPTKTLLYTAKLYDNAKYSDKYGINVSDVTFDFDKIMKRKNKVVRKLVGGVKLKMKKYNVEVINANAQIHERTADHIKIKSGEQIYDCKNLIIATGSSAAIPPIKGLERDKILTNREILQLEILPKSLTVIGGGVIGIEFASFFNSLECEVSVIEMMNEILPGIDTDISTMLRDEFTKKGVKFYLGSKVTEIKGNEVVFEKDGKVESISGEKILLSIGRRPNVEGFGLDKLGVEYSKHGVKIDTNCRTNIPNVYAIGDVKGFSLLAHTASREGEVAVNHILGKKDNMRYNAIPGVVYSNPEVASVGLTETEAIAKNIKYKVRKLSMNYVGRFVAENEGKDGFCKILVGEEYNEVLGVHMIGGACSEMIFGACTMIEAQLRLNDIEEVVFPHPTVSEIIKETAFAFED